MNSISIFVRICVAAWVLCGPAAALAGDNSLSADQLLEKLRKDNNLLALSWSLCEKQLSGEPLRRELEKRFIGSGHEERPFKADVLLYRYWFQHPQNPKKLLPVFQALVPLRRHPTMVRFPLQNDGFDLLIAALIRPPGVKAPVSGSLAKLAKAPVAKLDEILLLHFAMKNGEHDSPRISKRKAAFVQSYGTHLEKNPIKVESWIDFKIAADFFSKSGNKTIAGKENPAENQARINRHKGILKRDGVAAAGPEGGLIRFVQRPFLRSLLARGASDCLLATKRRPTSLPSSIKYLVDLAPECSTHHCSLVPAVYYEITGQKAKAAAYYRASLKKYIDFLKAEIIYLHVFGRYRNIMDMRYSRGALLRAKSFDDFAYSAWKPNIGRLNDAIARTGGKVEYTDSQIKDILKRTEQGLFPERAKPKDHGKDANSKRTHQQFARDEWLASAQLLKASPVKLEAELCKLKRRQSQLAVSTIIERGDDELKKALISVMNLTGRKNLYDSIFEASAKSLPRDQQVGWCLRQLHAVLQAPNDPLKSHKAQWCIQIFSAALDAVNADARVLVSTMESEDMKLQVAALTGMETLMAEIQLRRLQTIAFLGESADGSTPAAKGMIFKALATAKEPLAVYYLIKSAAPSSVLAGTTVEFLAIADEAKGHLPVVGTEIMARKSMFDRFQLQKFQGPVDLQIISDTRGLSHALSEKTHQEKTAILTAYSSSSVLYPITWQKLLWKQLNDEAVKAAFVKVLCRWLRDSSEQKRKYLHWLGNRQAQLLRKNSAEANTQMTRCYLAGGDYTFLEKNTSLLPSILVDDHNIVAIAQMIGINRTPELTSVYQKKVLDGAKQFSEDVKALRGSIIEAIERQDAN